MSKYIDAEKLIAVIERLKTVFEKMSVTDGPRKEFFCGKKEMAIQIICLITSLQQEQPEFPETDEEVEKALATAPKVELPDKYKTPDWLFKQQEHPQVADASKMEREVDLEKAALNFGEELGVPVSDTFMSIAHHFYEFGLNARKED